ncbi:ATP synthase subunit [Absidia repens]|uniref:ATP synthase subunit n=1 Tax=Absidia repens TaxID=90262 RepID=A0A1X2J0Z6_9FUNG|nr:ATP synthase subunit [Absidia repens]
MTSVRALNDDEVFNEMKKMADEEFNIEKAKIVRQESLNIEAVFERKIKQAEVQKRISQSNHINKARLRTLQQREQVLDALFEETRNRTQSLSSNDSSYGELLNKLVLQGAYTLMESDIVVRCRQEDVDKVEIAAKEAKEQFENTLKTSLNITIGDDYLPSSNAGGVILTGLKGKIVVDNTLEARLEIVKEDMLPQLRVILFGHSPNRKFFN